MNDRTVQTNMLLRDINEFKRRWLTQLQDYSRAEREFDALLYIVMDHAREPLLAYMGQLASAALTTPLVPNTAQQTKLKDR